MGKQINLEGILNNQFEPNYDFKLHYGNTTKINVLGAMKEAINQALELAVENARVSVEPVDMYRDAYFVNKQSILNTINQVI